SGYLGRRPARLHEPEKRMPFVRRFFQDLPGEIAVAQPDLRQFPAPFWPDEITQAATLLDDAGIGAVALHCRAADPQEFCYAATILLTQALGLPTAVDGRHRLYKVTPPTFQITALPPYFTELAPRYDAAFTPIVYSPGRRTQTVTRSGMIEITVPLSGTWAVQGLLSGSQQAQVQLLVDGVVTMPTRDPFAADTTAWRVALPWSAGQHTVTLALPAATLTDAASSDCAQLCLHNLSIRLVQPTPAAVPAPQPLTFVNAQGETATLQQSTLLVSPPVPAPPADQATTAWLVSTWRIDDALQQKVQSAPERAPALFVHLLDAQEAVVAQVDHQLGARHLLVPAEHLLYDFTPLPPTLDPTALRVTVGLWYPFTGAYFWQPTTTATATATSVTVGPLAPLTSLLDADVFSSGQE
ncbi:MAG: hypothetical protein KDE31_15295, partial [Caldilineaceae bacterium]|nr:hypothetical protein [Caldilineaceae bacterium]